MAKKSKGGRPTKLTQKLAEEICARLTEEPVYKVFADPKLPTERTYYNWLRKNPQFFQDSARARAIAALRDLDEAERRLDDAMESGEPIGLLRERLHHQRWKVSKLLPRSYGDKLALTDPDGLPVSFTLNIGDAGPGAEDDD